jgi:Flp pilus assembly protein TadB
VSRAAATRTATVDSLPDRTLYALFARHADGDRHARDRRRYRATDLQTSFTIYLARVYGLSWLVFLGLLTPTFAVAVAVPPATLSAVARFLQAGLPGLAAVGVPPVPRTAAAAGLALLVGGLGKHVVVRLGGLYLRWRAKARRSDIERTLPGAVRYLHALSSGSADRRAMLRKVADTDAYGETAVAFRKALNTAALTGSVDDGLRRVARDTPSQDALAPFLLKFREHADQGADALANYLRMESRMLGHRQRREREQAQGFLELLAEMFVVLLVLPALLVIVVTVMSVLAPGLSAPVETPVWSPSVRAVIVYASALFVLVVGFASALIVDGLRPPDAAVSYERPDDPTALVGGTFRNPACAAVVAVVPALAVVGGLTLAGYHPVNVVFLGYVAYALPVGLVALRRARLDDAKDREIKDFVHAVSGHVSLGRPFPAAVELVARDVDLGPLDDDVADLAFNLGLTTGVADAAGGPDPDAASEETADTADASGGAVTADQRAAALDRFVGRVGTPLAEQTMGLVTGALDAGSDTGTVFETLQTEIGRLHEQTAAFRSNMKVYVAVGWTTALLVVGIVVAVNLTVLDSFAQLSTLSATDGSGFALAPNAVKPARDRFRFYVVTQATMLASGWFAGTANRGWYEALFHSGLLVSICYVVFAGTGMV